MQSVQFCLSFSCFNIYMVVIAKICQEILFVITMIMGGYNLTVKVRFSEPEIRNLRR